MNVLSLAKEFFNASPHLRAEWSLEVYRYGIQKKPYTFWVGSEKAAGRSQKAYTEMARLLNALDCPSEISIKHQALRGQSVTQGISIPAYRQGFYRLFIHYKQDLKDYYLAFKWKDNTFFKQYFYENYPCKDLNILALTSQVKDELQPIFYSLLCEKKVSKHSMIWAKYDEEKPREYYIAFLWQPCVKEVMEKIRIFLGDKAFQKMYSYQDHNFRYMGFSTNEAKESALSFCFCSSLPDGIPNSDAELYSIIHDRARTVNEMLKRTYEAA